MLERSDGWELLVEEKLDMELLQRELLSLYYLLKMHFLTLYELKVPLLKAMVPQGVFENFKCPNAVMHFSAFKTSVSLRSAC